jgi:predicted MPP superfamily phosphohydrolase
VTFGRIFAASEEGERVQRLKNGSTASCQRKGITRRGFLGIGCGVLGGGLAACLLGPAYAGRVEPYWIEVTRLEIRPADLRAAFDGFTIVHLSDFHLGRSVTKEQVRRAVEIANGLEPDLLVLTGDFVTGSASHSVACAAELAALEARQGVYGVLGNHDNWTDPDEVAANVAGAGIVVLRDEVAVTTVRGSRLWLIGVEDTGFTAGLYGGSFSDFRAIWQEKELRLTAMLEGIPDDEPRLLLVHNPDFTEMLPTARIDLALCGHTHGGQVRVPFVGAPVVPSFFGDKYASGLVQGPSTLVYINRGIGLISPPVRFNCRPEVTLLRLGRSVDVPAAQDDV